MLLLYVVLWRLLYISLWGITVVAESIPVEKSAVGFVVGVAYVDAGIVPVAVGIVAAAAVVDTAVASATVADGTEVALEAVLGTGAGVVAADMPGTAAVLTVVVVAEIVRRRAVGQLPEHTPPTVVAVGTVEPAEVGPGER
jgi:hypothetical protein